MAKKIKDDEPIPTFDDGNGFVVSALEGRDAGHRVRVWAERFRHPNGVVDDSAETTKLYLEAYDVAAAMDTWNRHSTE
jgi:hypothetical protein